MTALDHFPVGLEMDVVYPTYKASMKLLSTRELRLEIKEGSDATVEKVEIQVVPLGNSLFAVSWQQRDGATVAEVHDYDRQVVHSHVTRNSGEFTRMTGTIEITRPADRGLNDQPQRNKALVLDSMLSLFQQHDSSAVERLLSPDYIQHNPHVPQGRDALQKVVEGLSAEVSYEPGMMIAEGNLVAIHGRLHGWGPEPQVVVDIFRVENGKIAEHWDVLQTDVSAANSKSGVAMFDPGEGK
ncbi:nuclear transport factor 2 family protein [Luteolibacter soli]|uniref:Nuclear transport factor 2 family protein n=1 Tax=Luteolibacter soli TaxID=3135280 RepID=A0ABU9B4G0_9BACT